MTEVLVVDGEPQIVRALRINLAARGLRGARRMVTEAGLGYRFEPDLRRIDDG